MLETQTPPVSGWEIGVGTEVSGVGGRGLRRERKMDTDRTNCPQFALDGGVSWDTGLSGQKQGKSGANWNNSSPLVSLVTPP